MKCEFVRQIIYELHHITRDDAGTRVITLLVDDVFLHGLVGLVRWFMDSVKRLGAKVWVGTNFENVAEPDGKFSTRVNVVLKSHLDWDVEIPLYTITYSTVGTLNTAEEEDKTIVINIVRVDIYLETEFYYPLLEAFVAASSDFGKEAVNITRLFCQAVRKLVELHATRMKKGYVERLGEINVEIEEKYAIESVMIPQDDKHAVQLFFPGRSIVSKEVLDKLTNTAKVTYLTDVYRQVRGGLDPKFEIVHVYRVLASKERAEEVLHILLGKT